MDGKDWILDLPGDALDSHSFESMNQVGGASATQTSLAPSSAKRKSPLENHLQNSHGSPRKKTTLRKPDKIVRGSTIVGGDVQRMLDKNPVLRDVVNELDGNSHVEIDKENIDIDVNGNLGVEAAMDMDLDMDADFDPTDFGIY
jgi:hypothetical protein